MTYVPTVCPHVDYELKKKLESVHRVQTPSQYIFQFQKLKENTKLYWNRTIFEKELFLTDFTGQIFEFFKTFYIFLFRVKN